MKHLFICITAVAFFSTAHAELPFKKKPQEFLTRRPGETAQTLRNGTPVQRNDLALELGILAPNPSGTGAKSNSPCTDFNHVEEKPVTLRADADNVVLLAESTACDSLYVVVFDRAPKSEWRHVQTLRLMARTQPPEVSFAELVQPGISEILVHKEITSDSGNVREQDFVVLKMIRDRIETVLDTTEQSEITLTNRSPEELDNLQQTQKSTFDLLKSPPNSAATYRLLEKEVITDNRTTITRFRMWTWDPQQARFRPAPFDAGNARPAPPQKKPAEAKPN